MLASILVVSATIGIANLSPAPTSNNSTAFQEQGAFGQKDASHFKTREDFELYVAAIDAVKNGEDLLSRPLTQGRFIGLCGRLPSLPTCACSETILGIELVCKVELPFDLGPLGVDLDFVLCPRIDISIDVLVSQFYTHSLGEFETGEAISYPIPGLSLGSWLIPGYGLIPFDTPDVQVELRVTAYGDATSLDIAVTVGACYDLIVLSGCLFEIPILPEIKDIQFLEGCWSPPPPSPSPPPPYGNSWSYDGTSWSYDDRPQGLVDSSDDGPPIVIIVVSVLSALALAIGAGLAYRCRSRKQKNTQENASEPPELAGTEVTSNL